MRRQKTNKPLDEHPALASEQDIVVTVSLCGHGMKYVSKREDADTVYIDKSGRESYSKRVSNVYGYEIRSATRMTGACRKLLHHDTLETKLDESPVVPFGAIYAARAREAFERIQQA